MSEMEKQEIIDRVKGMTLEEQRLVVSAIPAHVLIEELHRKNAETEKLLSGMAELLEGVRHEK